MVDSLDPGRRNLAPEHDGPTNKPGIINQEVEHKDQYRESIGDGDSDHSLPTSPMDNIEPAPVETIGHASHSKSRSSSVQTRPMSVIPRSERRGLFGRLTVIPEVERPYEYKLKQKWLITLFVALAAAAAPMGSSVFYREFYNLRCQFRGIMPQRRVGQTSTSVIVCMNIHGQN
jgi:hypothetical protein